MHCLFSVSYTHLDVYKRQALMMRHPKQKESLVALSVINDNNTSETKELIGKRNLERTAMIAAAADASVKTVLRYDLNIAQGIIHTQKEYAVTDIVRCV